MKDNYRHTCIIDYDVVEGYVVAKHVPRGYRFIEAYYSNKDGMYFAKGPSGPIVADIKTFVAAAKALARIGTMTDLNDESVDNREEIADWCRQFPDVNIQPETDIVLAGNIQYGKQYFEYYTPPNVEVIETDSSMCDPDIVKRVLAAQFLYGVSSAKEAASE